MQNSLALYPEIQATHLYKIKATAVQNYYFIMSSKQCECVFVKNTNQMSLISLW